MDNGQRIGIEREGIWGEGIGGESDGKMNLFPLGRKVFRETLFGSNPRKEGEREEKVSVTQYTPKFLCRPVTFTVKDRQGFASITSTVLQEI